MKCYKKISPFLLAVLLCGLLQPPTTAKTIHLASVYEAHIFQNSERFPNEELPYRLYCPEDYKEKPYPLVLQLNGAAQNGNDNVKHITPPNLFTEVLLREENSTEYPCIILAPQCPYNDRWVKNFYGDISQVMEMTLELLEEICNEYNVDRSRIYLVGFSSGASGVWDALFRCPKLFAAAIAMEGYTIPAFAKYIKNVPVWFFHCDEDHLIPVSVARDMADALQNAGSTVYQYTEYNYKEFLAANSEYGDNAHGVAWAQGSNYEPELLPWLFSWQNKHFVSPGDYLKNGFFDRKVSDEIENAKSQLLIISVSLTSALILISAISLFIYRQRFSKYIGRQKTHE